MLTQLLENARAVRERDPAARSTLEVLLCYPGLHALALHRAAHFSWSLGLFLPARVLSQLGRWLTGIEIHPGAKIGRRVFIDHGMGVVIGETAEVGDDCTIYQGVTLGGTSLTRGAKRHPTLAQGVVVGAGAKVLGPFTVGAGASVGANAVVVREVPPGVSVAGIPARVLERSADRGAAPAPQTFTPYGVALNADDPMSVVLRRLIDHVQAQDLVIARLRQAVERAGIDPNCTGCEPIDATALNRMVD